jgi:sigma-B regulation protein RsbU (phosphoserine phosphatase)
MTQPVLILVIDDMDSNLFMLSTMLRREGFDVATALSGPEGRKLAAERHPDLILLDIVMPGESGFATCELLKKDPATAAIPIVFLSALEETENKIKGLELGAADFVSKPFMKEEILVRIRSQILLRRNRNLFVENLGSYLDADGADGGHPPSISFPIPIAEGIGAFFCARASAASNEGVRAVQSLRYLLPRIATPLLAPEEALGMVGEVLLHTFPSAPSMSAAYCVYNRNASRCSVVLAGNVSALLADTPTSAFYCGYPGEPLIAADSPLPQRVDYPAKPGARFCAILAELDNEGIRENFRQRFLGSVRSSLEEQRPFLAEFLAGNAGIAVEALFLFDLT